MLPGLPCTPFPSTPRSCSAMSPAGRAYPGYPDTPGPAARFLPSAADPNESSPPCSLCRDETPAAETTLFLGLGSAPAGPNTALTSQPQPRWPRPVPPRRPCRRVAAPRRARLRTVSACSEAVEIPRHCPETDPQPQRATRPASAVARTAAAGRADTAPPPPPDAYDGPCRSSASRRLRPSRAPRVGRGPALLRGWLATLVARADRHADGPGSNGAPHPRHARAYDSEAGPPRSAPGHASDGTPAA